MNLRVETWIGDRVSIREVTDMNEKILENSWTADRLLDFLLRGVAEPAEPPVTS